SYLSTATTPPHLYTLSLHDALPISSPNRPSRDRGSAWDTTGPVAARCIRQFPGSLARNPECETPSPRGRDISIRSADVVTDLNRSEEHTSELQSRFDIVCRLLL